METRVLDAENFLEMVYSKSISYFCNNIKHYYRDEEKGIGKRSVERWRSLHEIPAQKYIDSLREKTRIAIDDPLSISDVLLKVNLTKDNQISSNGKKVFNLMALCDDKCLDCSGGELYEYLIKRCKMTPKSYNTENEVAKVFGYIPCRSVTVEMLVNAGKKYGYNEDGIIKGLDNLVANGLVVKNKDNDFYKLSFSGIKKL